MSKQRRLTGYLGYQHYTRTAGKISWNTKQRKKYDVIHYYFPCSIVQFFNNFHVLGTMLGPPSTAVSTQWQLWIQQQSIAKIKCCSKALKPIVFYHCIILSALFHYFCFKIPHSSCVLSMSCVCKEELKQIPPTNSCKHSNKTEAGIVTHVNLIFPLFSSVQ